MVFKTTSLYGPSNPTVTMQGDTRGVGPNNALECRVLFTEIQSLPHIHIHDMHIHMTCIHTGIHTDIHTDIYTHRHMYRHTETYIYI